MEAKTFMKCCNPRCEVPFDYREGRLARFSEAITHADTPEAQVRILHFWLCAECAEIYVFEHHAGTSVRIKPRLAERPADHPSHFVSAA
jgi:hypothetical protein